MNDVNYYKILEVSPTADEDEIKRSYRRLVIKHHPDSCGSGNYKEEFYKIQDAYKFLSNKERRRQYDEKLSNKKKVNSWQEQDPLTFKHQTKEEIISKLHRQNKQNISNIQNVLNRHATSQTLKVGGSLRFQSNAMKEQATRRTTKDESFLKKLFG